MQEKDTRILNLGFSRFSMVYVLPNGSHNEAARRLPTNELPSVYLDGIICLSI